VRPCLDPACVGFDVDLTTYLAAAAGGGFKLVETPITWVAAVAAERGAVDVPALFRRYEVTPVQFTCGLGTPGNIAVPAELFELRLRALPELAALGRAIGCQRASLFIDEHRSEGVPTDTDLLAERVRRIAAVLTDAGLGFSLGLIGRERLVTVEDLWTAADCPGVGLLVDTISLAKAGLGREWIDALPPGRVGWFRVADAPAGVAGADLTYADRLLPGTGCLPLAALYAAACRNGYQGPVSVEVGDPALRRHPPGERARLAYAHTVCALTASP
jgi:sugar phosphate isomerase/epimerase